MAQANNNSWKKIFDEYDIHNHPFEQSPFSISAEQIKRACQDFTKTNEKEVRILCKQDSRRDRPDIFKEKGLFLLPIKNGHYNIIKGEGYIDIPEITGDPILYKSKLNFKLDTSTVGHSEMQYIDYAYASSLIKYFIRDHDLVLTIRGRKYTENPFSFCVNNHRIQVKGVQTEVDAGYESKNKVVLIEAKSVRTDDLIIRQLYYPFMKWRQETSKNIINLFFQKNSENIYSIWQFKFKSVSDYNSIHLVVAKKFKIIDYTGSG